MATAGNYSVICVDFAYIFYDFVTIFRRSATIANLLIIVAYTQATGHARPRPACSRKTCERI